MALITQTFTSSTTWTVPSDVTLINKVFVVGGGGGGGNTNGGGGGGGRVTLQENFVVTPGASLTVTVGNGGGAGGNGVTSSFDSVTAAGGGGGASNLGGGGSSAGGVGGTPSARTGGGGASPVSPGKNAGDFPGVGADGYYWIVTGNYYGGGGQGGSPNTTQYSVDIPVTRSQGGGGAGGGATRTSPAEAGTVNTGGGGGGGRGTGGAGGRGIVIIQYYEPDYELTSDVTGISEGETITFTLRTRNVPNGTTVNYVLSGTGVTGSDFSTGTLSGSFTITSTDSGANGTGTAAITLVNDSTTEGNEVVTLSVVGTSESATFTIGDSSVGAVSSPESITIRRADYNNVQTTVANVLGTGTGDRGYGQTVLSSQVSVSNKVSVNDYANLKNDIISAYKHIYGTTPSLVDASESLKVKANALTAPYKQYELYANILDARRLSEPPGSQSLTTNHGTITYTSDWTALLTATVQVSFTTAEKARFFFNSGGEFRFFSSRTGGTSNTHNNTWTSLLGTAGTQAFGGGQPSLGTTPTDGTNYHRLTSSFQPWYEANASSPYAENYYRISARHTGTPNVIQFKIEWEDDYFAGDAALDTVDGTLAYAVTSLKATGTLSPSGTFTIETPTVTLGTITGS